MKNMKFDFFGSVVNNIQLEILEHGHFFGDEAWKHYNVTSPFNRLYFVIDGEAHIENEYHRVPLKKGNVYLVPLHSTYDYICNSLIEKFYLHFRVELFEGHDIFENVNHCMSMSIDESSINIMIDKVKNNDVRDMVYCKAFFFEIISQFIRPLPGDMDRQVDTALKYHRLYQFIKSNCFAGTSIKQFAEHMNMSASSLVKSFKRDNGYTLKSYINGRIIEKAKEKLLLTDMSIKEIASQLKFSDEFYFSRFFKRYSGISPKEYRLRNRLK